MNGSCTDRARAAAADAADDDADEDEEVKNEADNAVLAELEEEALQKRDLRMPVEDGTVVAGAADGR